MSTSQYEEYVNQLFSLLPIDMQNQIMKQKDRFMNEENIDYESFNEIIITTAEKAGLVEVVKK